MPKLSKSDMKWFGLARQEAMSSTYQGFHLGCVLVYKGHAIGSGSNSCKTHPAQKVYNRKYRKFKYGPQLVVDSLHAEMSALMSVPYAVGVGTDWSKVKVYIYRISRGRLGGHGMARPCPGCLHALKDRGIRDVYYTTDDGFAYERID